MISSVLIFVRRGNLLRLAITASPRDVLLPTALRIRTSPSCTSNVTSVFGKRPNVSQILSGIGKSGAFAELLPHSLVCVSMRLSGFVPALLLPVLAFACGGSLPRGRAGAGFAPKTDAVAVSAAIVPIAGTPLALTNADGTGLKVESLSAKVEVLGSFASTELNFVFLNDLRETIEGRFRLRLPPHSHTTKLSMKMGAGWREAEVAELGAARRTYETIVHRTRDPLLVEQWREREIAARIFPIAPGEIKEVFLSYTSDLGPDAPVVVPLRGLPIIGELQVSVLEGKTEVFARHTMNEAPAEDLRYAPAIVREAEESSAARTDRLIDSPMVFLLETPASQADRLAAKAILLTEIAAELIAAEPSAGAVQVAVIAYDQTSERIFAGRLEALSRSSVSMTKALMKRGGLGALDVEHGLAMAVVEARRIAASSLWAAVLRQSANTIR
jgi:Vault protein inter-alpha-trypsin domain